MYRAVRVDEWTPEDDLILAEITLRHIRNNSTLKAAFNECGQRIGRTESACQSRWNSNVKLRYPNAIEIAKSKANTEKTRK